MRIHGYSRHVVLLRARRPFRHGAAPLLCAVVAACVDPYGSVHSLPWPDLWNPAGESDRGGELLVRPAALEDGAFGLFTVRQLLPVSVCEKAHLLLREPWPRDPEAETATQPPIWCSDNL